MCGRYTVSDPSKLVDELKAEPAGLDTHGIEPTPRYNVAPTQNVLVVRQDSEGRRHLGQLHWGLVPFWAKEKSIGNRMINARSETAAEKPSFRNAWKKRRCWIAADGFYEWKKMDGGKQPFHIHLHDRRPFVLAGLWERWEKGEAPLESCTILTTRANEKVAEIHDRMPVILDGAARDRWLDPATPPAALGELMVPFDAERMAFTPVSRLVNNPKNDVPRCLEPVQL
ncbi:MAG: SOS response-associated peptidase [Holophagales bacterium]|nr:SOS response-associated peptidase [Holophagales bacterium]